MPHQTVRKGHQVLMDTIPDCDICKAYDGVRRPAKYDSRLPGLLPSAWGYVCRKHWVMYGPGITGVGHGQELILRVKS